MKGLVHIYTGNGKGKTTAAVGLGIRAYGRGLKVLMIQFLKGIETGELKTFEKLSPDFRVERGKTFKKFIWDMSENEIMELRESICELFSFAFKNAVSGDWDVLILDELMASISNELLTVEDVIKLIEAKPDKLELVMTGRNAPSELIELSDYVSDINSVKHPFDKGVSMRKGIEY